MNNKDTDAMRIMTERFGHDMLIAIATLNEGAPAVRTVDAYYENGSFYVITHALSNKVAQITANPSVAVCGEWFTAQGQGENIGWFKAKNNEVIASKLENAFSAWLSNGHSDLDDVNTIILRIKLSHGTLASNGEWYTINFAEHFS